MAIHSHQKSRCFASSGLGLARHIMPIQGHGKGQGLDGRAFRESRLLDAFHDFRRDI